MNAIAMRGDTDHDALSRVCVSSLVLDCHTSHIACRFNKLLQLVNKRNGTDHQTNKHANASPPCVIGVCRIEPRVCARH
jgi:translation elongation factor EF-1alpha